MIPAAIRGNSSVWHVRKNGSRTLCGVRVSRREHALVVGSNEVVLTSCNGAGFIGKPTKCKTCRRVQEAQQRC